MKHFLMTSAALVALALPVFAEEEESSYMIQGAVCTTMDAIPQFEVLIEKYSPSAESVMVAAAEHNLPCIMGSIITKEKIGRRVMPFIGTNNKNYDILAWQWGEATVFSMAPAAKSPAKQSSY